MLLPSQASPDSPRHHSHRRHPVHRTKKVVVVVYRPRRQSTFSFISLGSRTKPSSNGHFCLEPPGTPTSSKRDTERGPSPMQRVWSTYLNPSSSNDPENENQNRSSGGYEQESTRMNPNQTDDQGSRSTSPIAHHYMRQGGGSRDYSSASRVHADRQELVPLSSTNYNYDANLNFRDSIYSLVSLLCCAWIS